MFGDELLAGSYRGTTWLVWIHLLVMLLLILVLSCCVVAFGSDLAPHSSAAVTGASASAVLTPTKPNYYPPLRNTASRSSPRCLIKREPVGEDNATSSSRRAAEEEEVNGEGVGSSPASGAPTNLGEFYRFFRVATLALLKCLGLDSTATGRRRRGK